MTNRLVPAAALVIALAIFFGYVSPTYSGSVAEIKERVMRATSALDAAARFGEKQNELASARNAILVDDLARLEALLPDSVDNVSVILDLTSLATRSGLLLSSINVAASPAGGGQEAAALSRVGSIDLRLSATGSYESFIAFIAGVERSARLLDVTAFAVRGSNTGVYGYNLTVRLYWLR